MEAGTLTEELADELAEAEQAETRPRRQGAGRKAEPLAVVKEAVAAMQAEGQKVSGPTLAERLGANTRTAHRRLSEVQAA
ncbi:hypothetical protein J7I98_31395 [Streptomyces sp. ISL-98]|uniref:hypothetical protein n=1 Tax=Streptomyces sp. ISL-98 TaxID=2819192 RepID=UPI001BEC6106|nr:hypothetical protein [Streptomyces sp. ISL-98]MBT2510282.1 hypothetical protein [Streptomyces sp. ISL-98]